MRIPSYLILIKYKNINIYINIYLETVLVLTTNEQPQLLCGIGRVVPENQLLLAEKQWQLFVMR